MKLSNLIWKEITEIQSKHYLTNAEREYLATLYLRYEFMIIEEEKANWIKEKNNENGDDDIRQKQYVKDRL